MRLQGRAGNRQKLLSAGAPFALALLCVPSFAPRVLAQQVAAPRVHYEATGVCPTQAEFVARMRTRMDADGTRAPADISLRVTLSAQAGAAHGTIEIRRGAANTRRIVDGGRCEEVAEALALIAALAVRDADPANDPRPRARKAAKNTSPAGTPTKRTAPAPGSELKRAEGAARTPDGSGADTTRAGSATSEAGRSTSQGADPARSTALRAAGGSDIGTTSSSSTDGSAAQRAAASEAGASSRGAPARDEHVVQGRAGTGLSDARGNASLARSAEGRRGASDAAERSVQDEAPRGDEGTNDARGGAVDVSGGRDNLKKLARGPSSERAVFERNGTPEDAAAQSGSDARPSAKAARSQDLASNANWRVGATAMLFSGLAPQLQPGLQLQAAVALDAGALAWSLQLGARIARSAALASPDGDARFGFAGGMVRLCAAHPLGSTPLTLTGCAAAEPGIFSATGENTRNRRSHSRLWLAAGAAADLDMRLASWLSLRAGAELLAPLRRDRIVLAGDTLYRVPPLGFRWYLGLEVPFG